MEDTGTETPQTVLDTPMLSVDCQTQERLLLTRVTGRLDGSNAATFRRALDSLPIGDHRACILDLEGLTYISSDGLRVFLGFRRALSEGSCKLALCSLPESILTVFEISGFDRVITIYPDARAASAASDAPRGRG